MYQQSLCQLIGTIIRTDSLELLSSLVGCLLDGFIFDMGNIRKLCRNLGRLLKNSQKGQEIAHNQLESAGNACRMYNRMFKRQSNALLIRARGSSGCYETHSDC